jgi:alanyl-tRNA synthetase
LLGAESPLMHRLVPALVRQMGDTYGELTRGEALITETLKLEETKFRKTLENGLKLLDEASGGMTQGAVFPGDVAFKLYDTFGFPLDLTQDALRARDINVDQASFTAAMELQKQQARAAWKGSGDVGTDAVWFEVRERTGATDFLGYDTQTAEGIVGALVQDGKEVATLKTGQTGALILNQTPFYGESGGQVGDSGLIKGPKGAVFRVTSTDKKLGDVFVHSGILEQGSLAIGDAVELVVDHDRRTAIRANHSATHLLHEALRHVLGPHVAQKGSLVSPERLRFDFSHTKPMSVEEIASVERLANAIVLQNAPIETRLMAVDDAIASGAMALFGEKYGDEVRVVSMGDALPNANKAWSVELCGGTHARRTGDIGLIKVLAETGSSAGVRRIEALTADGARTHLVKSDETLREAASLLRARPDDVVERLKGLVEEKRQLEKQLGDAKRQLAMSGGHGTAAPQIEDVGGVKFLGLAVSGFEMNDLKSLADERRATIGSGVIAIANASVDGKLGIVVAVTKDLAGRISAVDLVRDASEKAGGKGGGGRPDMAQAGGPDGSLAAVALESIKSRLSQ